MIYTKKTTILAGALIILTSFGASAAVTTKIDFAAMDTAVGGYTKSATADLEQRKGAIGTLMTNKGHDDIVGPMLTKLHERIESLQKDIKELNDEST